MISNDFDQHCLLIGFSRDYRGDKEFNSNGCTLRLKDFPTFLFNTALHEIGHSLGLTHSEQRDNAMFPMLMSYREEYHLGKDDIARIQKMYGPPKVPGTVGEVPGDPVATLTPNATDKAGVPGGPPVSYKPPIIPATQKPHFDYCNITIDAILEIPEVSLVIFKDNWYWQMKIVKTPDGKRVYKRTTEPMDIHVFFSFLPPDVKNIDAIHMVPDGRAYLFSGNRVWVYHGYSGKVLLNGVRPMMIGIPATVTKVDAMFQWSGDNKVYIVSENRVFTFRYAETTYGVANSKWESVQEKWPGVPVPMTEAFSGPNGETLFFQKDNYYVMPSGAVRVEDPHPKKARLEMLGCEKP